MKICIQKTIASLAGVEPATYRLGGSHPPDLEKEETLEHAPSKAGGLKKRVTLGLSHDQPNF